MTVVTSRDLTILLLYRCLRQHIDIQIHFIEKKVTNESIDLVYIFIDQMIVDDLIKSLVKNKFVQFRVALEIE